MRRVVSGARPLDPRALLAVLLLAGVPRIRLPDLTGDAVGSRGPSGADRPRQGRRRGARSSFPRRRAVLELEHGDARAHRDLEGQGCRPDPGRLPGQPDRPAPPALRRRPAGAGLSRAAEWPVGDGRALLRNALPGGGSRGGRLPHCRPGGGGAPGSGTASPAAGGEQAAMAGAPGSAAGHALGRALRPAPSLRRAACPLRPDERWQRGPVRRGAEDAGPRIRRGASDRRQSPGDAAGAARGGGCVR